MMSRAWILISLVAAGACADLPDITPGICGNLTVDADEDCEGKVVGLSCVECRFVCSPQEAQPACPAGWACNTSGICAHGSLAFDATSSIAARFPSVMTTANIAGDTSDELLLFDAENRGLIRIDGATRLLSATPESSRVDIVAVGDLTGDAYDEVVSVFSPLVLDGGDSEQGLYAARGGADRLTILPALSAFEAELEGALPRVAYLEEPLLADPTRVAAWMTGSVLHGLVGKDTLGPVTVDGTSLLPLRVGHVLPTQLAVGHDQQAVAAVSGGSSVYVVGLSQTAGGDTVVTEPYPLTTPASGPIIDVRLADTDLDGRAEVIVATSSTLYQLAIDAAGAGHWSELGPRLDALPANSVCPRGPCEVPLASADVDADGIADYVTRHGFIRGGARVYRRLVDGGIAHAVIADIDGNHKLDVVTAGSQTPSVAYLLNFGNQSVPGTVSTADPVVHLLGANLDGNGYADIVLATAAPGSPVTHISYLDGDDQGFPSLPLPIVDVPALHELVSVPETPSTELAVTGVLDGQLYRSRLEIATANVIALSQVPVGEQIAALAIGNRHGDGASDDIYLLVQAPSTPLTPAWIHVLPDQRSYLTTINESSSRDDPPPAGELAGPLQLLDLTGDNVDEAVVAAGATLSRWDPLTGWGPLGIDATPVRAVMRGETDCLAFSTAMGVSVLCGDAITVLTTEPALAMTAIQADADLQDELAVVFADRVSLFDIDALAAPSELPVTLVGPAVRVAAADLDGDGVLDLAIASAPTTMSDGTLQIFWGVPGRGGL